MKKEKLIEVLEQFDIKKNEDILDFFDIPIINLELTWFQFSPDLKIRLEGHTTNNWRTLDEIQIISFDLIAEFHNKPFEFTIPKRYVDDDFGGASYMSGDSSLMESLTELIEYDYWEHLVILLNFYETVIINYLNDV